MLLNLRNLILRIVKSKGSVVEVLLILVEIVTFVSPKKKLLDIYFKLFISPATRTQTTLRFLMLEEANFSRNFRMRQLCWILIERIDSGRELKKPEDFAVFINIALSTGDCYLLETILGMQTKFDELPGYLELLTACIKFVNQDPDWITSINKCASSSNSKNNVKDVRLDYIQYTRNYSAYDDYNHMLDQVEFLPIKGVSKTNPLVLVSCDSRYFAIFAEYFCRQFRQNNDLEILFCVVIDENSDIAGFEDTCHRLTKYSNVCIRSRQIHENIGLRSSIERYIIACDLMAERQSGVAVFDIDLNINFDVIEFFENDENKISINLNTSSAIPWSRFSACFVFFPYSAFSLYFLKLTQRYIQIALRNDPQWTLDQTAMMIVTHYLSSRNHVFKFNEIDVEIIQKMTRSVPFKVRSSKWSVKRLNI